LSIAGKVITAARLKESTMARISKSINLPTQIVIPYVEQGDPSGVPIIFLHAIADSWHTFEPVLSDLPESIHAFALTQRGHGDASRPRSGYRSVDFAQDLKAFMDMVHLERVVIAGGSSGGFIARRFAMNYLERTVKLVLLGSPGMLRDKAGPLELWDSIVSKMTDPVDPIFVRQFVDKTLPRQVPQALLETLVQESLKVPAYVWKETYEGLLEEDLSGLSTIKAPTLIVWGDQDELIPLSDQEKLSKAISNSRLVVYPGIGHVVYLEAPERVASDIVSFLSNAVI